MAEGEEDLAADMDDEESSPAPRQPMTLMNFLSAQRPNDTPDDDDAPRSPFDDLRTLSSDSNSPIIGFNLDTLSRLRDSGVSPATALALLQEAVRIGKTSVISVILDSYKDQVRVDTDVFCLAVEMTSYWFVYFFKSSRRWWKDTSTRS